jgi:hypothetical protein
MKTGDATSAVADATPFVAFATSFVATSGFTGIASGTWTVSWTAS